MRDLLHSQLCYQSVLPPCLCTLMASSRFWTSLFSQAGLFRPGLFDFTHKLIEQAIVIVRIAPLAFLFCLASSLETEAHTRLKQVPTCAADNFGPVFKRPRVSSP